jgi:hypothetical protein
VPEAEVNSFLEWLPAHRFSQKHADAVAMLQTIRQRVERGLEAKTVRYSFENSSMWEQAWRLAGERYAAPGGETTAIDLDMVLDELRLEGDRYLQAEQAAILRCLSIKQSYVQGLAESAAPAAPGWWDGFDNKDDGAKRRWMSANNLDPHQADTLLEDEARVGWIRTLAAFEAAGYLLDHLRITGDYPRLMGRAASKQSVLESSGLSDPTLDDTGLDRARLLEWYFEDRLGRGVPADLRAYSEGLGFSSEETFQRSVMREYCFVRRATAS